MILKPVAVLGAVSLLMGGCVHPLDAPSAYTALSPDAPVTPSSPMSDASDIELEPVVMPGQVRASALRQTGGGVDPIAALRASARARAAWRPLNPAELMTAEYLTAPPVGVRATANATATTANAVAPVSTNSALAPAETNPGQGGIAQSYNTEATVDRLEKEASSVLAPTEANPGQGGIAQWYNSEATVDRAEKEGGKDAKPNCSGC